MEALDETRCKLNDIGTLFERFASLEAWGKIIHVELPAQQNYSEMILDRRGVDFYSNGINVDFQRFKEEARRLSLSPRSMTGGIRVSPDVQTPAPLFVEIRGEWSDVASQVVQLIKGVYGTSGDDYVVVTLYK